MSYICEECEKQFREGQGLEHEEWNTLHFFCSLECFRKWNERKQRMRNLIGAAKR